MREYRINQLIGEAYNNAVANVVATLNSVMGLKCFIARDTYAVDILAERLAIRFDEEGRIID